MNIKLIKLYCLVFILVLVSPAGAYAGVHFITRDDSSQTGNYSKPCYIDYPLYSCSGGKVPSVYCPTDNRYFKHCVCDAKYKFTSCSDNKTHSGASCDGKFESCTCNTSLYRWNQYNCPNNQVPIGRSCDGLYEACGCPAYYSKTCSGSKVGSGGSCGGKYQSCVCSGNYKTCDYGGAAGASSCTEDNGTVKWSSCKTGSCSEGGYLASVPANQKCTQVTYNAKTCYSNCKAQSCEDGGYMSSAPANQKCSTIAFAGKTCYTGCNAVSCEEGGYKSSVPANQTCTQVGYGGKTCYKDCGPICNYNYTTSSCIASYGGKNLQGTVSGKTCKKNGVTHYEHCDTCSVYKSTYRNVDYYADVGHVSRVCTSGGKTFDVCFDTKGVSSICEKNGQLGCSGNRVMTRSPYVCYTK